MTEMARKSKEENDKVTQFRLQFESEQARLDRQKVELDTYATQLERDRLQLEQERNDISQMQRKLEGIRHSFIKTIDARSPSPMSPSTIAHRHESFTSDPKLRSETTQSFFRSPDPPVNRERERMTGFGGQLGVSRSSKDLRQTFGEQMVSAKTEAYRRELQGSFDSIRHI